MTRVLVTGFEPFGGDPVNPSLEAIRCLADDPPPAGIELATRALPVVYGDALVALRDAIEQHDPDVVVATGLAGGRCGVTPEKVAVNLDDAPAPDNAGGSPVDRPIVADGPTAYFSTLPVKAIVAAMRDAGIPASVSHTAGTYVCNHVFYGLMHLLATERPGTRGGFVHVPYANEQIAARGDAASAQQPSLALATITQAVRIAVATSVTEDVDLHTRAGAIA